MIAAALFAVGLVFHVMFIQNRKRGGYRIEKL